MMDEYVAAPPPTRTTAAAASRCARSRAARPPGRAGLAAGPRRPGRLRRRASPRRRDRPLPARLRRLRRPRRVPAARLAARRAHRRRRARRVDAPRQPRHVPGLRVARRRADARRLGRARHDRRARRLRLVLHGAGQARGGGARCSRSTASTRRGPRASSTSIADAEIWSTRRVDTLDPRPRERHVPDGRDGPARVAAHDARRPRLRRADDADARVQARGRARARAVRVGVPDRPRVRSTTSRPFVPARADPRRRPARAGARRARRGHATSTTSSALPRGVVALKLLVIWRDDDRRARAGRAGASGSSSWRSGTACCRCSSRSSRRATGGAIVEAARELGATRPVALQVPGAARGRGDRRDHARAARSTRSLPVPWVVLSQGVDAGRLPARGRGACRGGASGMLAGRAVWTATLAADDPTELLRDASVPRLRSWPRSSTRTAGPGART